MSIQTPIRGLRSFCVAAKCLSFKHAANQLFLTPSAVSHQIKQLESQLGTTLFKRQTRSIELTNAGKQFYQSIQPIITNLENTIADFTNNQQNLTISISLPEFFASELFVPKLSEWAALNPEINLQLDTVKSGDNTSSKADLSIVLTNSSVDASRNGCIVHDLFPIRYVPACNKAIYQQWKAKDLEALAKVPLILHQSRPWAWHQWAEHVELHNFDPCQIIQFDSMFGVARAAQQGMGIALIPLPISKAWFSEGFLIKLFEQELITRDRYYLIQHDTLTPSPELLTFANWVKDNFVE